MLVDSELSGNWMASAFLPDGIRIDHALSLLSDGSFIWRTHNEGAAEQVHRGTWHHDQADQIIHFSPDKSKMTSINERPVLWRMLRIVGFEGATNFMVLRWMALASRNLPVMFYRVHLA